MIIGIDETGDFSPKSDKLSFFIAVLLDQSDNGLKKKQEQFTAWLNTIPKEKINEKGEVKGSDLEEHELLSFVKTVYNHEPISRVEIVCFNPIENPEELMLKIKAIEVNKLIESAKIARENGNEEKAKYIEKMSIWYRNAKKMHYQHFLKLILLRNLITHTFETSVGVSILLEMLQDKNSSNLLNIEFKIDQDFVRGDEALKYWKSLLRASFVSYNLKHPLPALDTWNKTGHPFLEKYKTSNKEQLNFTEIFNDKCNFGESETHFEIQMADIIGIIVNRFHNRNKAISAYNALWTEIKEPKLRKIILNEKPLSEIDSKNY